jgi:hypothetical protein
MSIADFSRTRNDQADTVDHKRVDFLHKQNEFITISQCLIC